MADPVLHIKDAYFFEVPKFLWQRKFEKPNDVLDASEVWVELDDQFQEWEFHKQYDYLAGKAITLPPQDEALHDWQHWQHDDHANDSKPFDEFLYAKSEAAKATFNSWKAKQVAEAKTTEEQRDANQLTFADFKASGAYHADAYDGFVAKQLTDTTFAADWKVQRNEVARAKEYIGTKPKWSQAKLDGYGSALSGKILIPQPFGGRLRNLHEAESGITISKFMLVEVAVALTIAILFSWLARRVIGGAAPKGRMWNFLEVFVVFIRTQIAEPAIGSGHHDHEDEHDAPGEHGPKRDMHGHVISDTANAGHGHDAHGPEAPAYDHYKQDQAAAAKKGHAHAAVSPAKRFTPLLCSIFFFILGCNLAGMLPWIGSPTAVFGVTLAMALVTLCTVFLAGMLQFGVLGFFANQVPTMDMPLYMAVVLKPFIFCIELGGLLIKHGVLGVRLLANMLAGHIVLLAIMGVAFGATAAAQFIQADGSVSSSWWISASIAIVSCAILSLLELFVAFLQAFVFTMLSALFIGAAIHKH